MTHEHRERGFGTAMSRIGFYDLPIDAALTPKLQIVPGKTATEKGGVQSPFYDGEGYLAHIPEGAAFAFVAERVDPETLAVLTSEDADAPPEDAIRRDALRKMITLAAYHVRTSRRGNFSFDPEDIDALDQTIRDMLAAEPDEALLSALDYELTLAAARFAAVCES